MSDYATKLQSLSARKQKLVDEEQRLIERRKKEIGTLAERLGLLTVSDALLAGLFLNAKHMIHTQHTTQLHQWETDGAAYLTPKSNRTSAPKKSTAAKDA